jgi:CubicO group peptidase (beta-lactamase class C family)
MSGARLASAALAPLLAAGLLACAAKPDTRGIELLMAPPFSDSNADGFWETANAAGLGIDPEALKRHIALCRETGADSQIVISDGRIVSEWYSERYRLPVYAMSSTKAVTALLVGRLLGTGGIGSLDDTVGRYAPEWSGGLRDRVTIGHILRHASGMTRKLERGKSVGFEADKTGFVLGLEPEREPGTEYHYSNEAVQLLDAVIESASGMGTAAFARAELFEPLGMADSSLNLDAMGHAWTYADMRTTARDMARVGQLMLEGGAWRGERVIGESFVAEATSPSATNPEMGYLWWILYAGGARIGYYASGYLNTDIYVLPAKRMVIVRTQAPKGGYTGSNESGDYFKRAMGIFRDLLAR